MVKLKKADFDKQFRFREPREEGLVKCITCSNVSGGVKRDEVAFCNHPERCRRVQIVRPWGSSWGTGKFRKFTNLASMRVCDAYNSKPLPEGVTIPTLTEEQGIELGTQWFEPYHADVNCPYVLEELRFIASGGKTERGREGEIRLADLSEMVSGQIVRDMCDMPCCERKLQFQIWDPNGYRTHVEIHPNGLDPKIWVRNGRVKHGRKSAMTLEEAEAFFDLNKFNNPKVGDIYKKISAVSYYLMNHANRLGSRSLSEAVNPVQLGNSLHILDSSLVGANSGADIWVYDERLFDFKNGILGPLGGLEQIPEGIIPCMDTKMIFRHLRRVEEVYRTSETYHFYGILKPLENQTLLSKGLSHFVDIRAVSYHAHEHLWGEFGIGFSELASFHED